METEAESIRRAVGARTKQRYSEQLKARILRYARQRRADGATQRTVAEEVGVKWQTIRRWMEAEQPAPTAMVPVSVRQPSAQGSQLALVSPTGYRLEGLPPQHAVQLFRQL